MNTMNILFLSINVPPSSQRDKIAYNFIIKDMEHLCLKGFNVYYLSHLKEDRLINKVHFISKDNLLEKKSVIRRLRNIFFALCHLKFFGLLSFKYPLRVLRICSTERACIKLIRKYNIQLVHTNFFEPEGESCIISSELCGIPLIATLHGADIAEMPQFDYGACMDLFYKSMLFKSILRINSFTVPKKYFAHQLIDKFHVVPKKIHYVPIGIENITIRKTNSNNELRFISISNMIKLKNLDIIFDNIAELSRDFKFHWIIVGSGPLRSNYEIVSCCQNNITILNEMPKHELYQLISTCDCLIHPSFSEGGPLVVLESLAIGVPCLVSDIQSHREIISEGISGFFFDPYSNDSFIAKMRYILANRHILWQMKDECISSVKPYSLDSRIDSFIEIYNSLSVK